MAELQLVPFAELGDEEIDRVGRRINALISERKTKTLLGKLGLMTTIKRHSGKPKESVAALTKVRDEGPVQERPVHGYVVRDKRFEGIGGVVGLATRVENLPLLVQTTPIIPASVARRLHLTRPPKREVGGTNVAAWSTTMLQRQNYEHSVSQMYRQLAEVDGGRVWTLSFDAANNDSGNAHRWGLQSAGYLATPDVHQRFDDGEFSDHPTPLSVLFVAGIEVVQGA